jgi:hypothetical protein
MSRVLAIALAGLVVVGAVLGIAAVREGNEPRLAATAAVAGLAPAERAPATTRPTTTDARVERSPRRRGGPDPSTCPATRRGAVLDRETQRAWLCRRGEVIDAFPVTTAIIQPDPGTYAVYAKERQSTSDFGGRPTQLDYFVAFTYGKVTGARIAFHALPRYFDGTLAQPPESVGRLELRGVSAGCIRVRPDDAVTIWDFLAVGDEVRVIS